MLASASSAGADINTIIRTTEDSKEYCALPAEGVAWPQFRFRHIPRLHSASYVLSSSRSWGGQPTASYSGNGIAITPENQFKPEEFGPTRIDDRHRIVASGLFDLGYGFQLAPIVQFATARPYSPIVDSDIDGDGRSTVDRICAGVSAYCKQ